MNCRITNANNKSKNKNKTHTQPKFARNYREFISNGLCFGLFISKCHIYIKCLQWLEENFGCPKWRHMKTHTHISLMLNTLNLFCSVVQIGFFFSSFDLLSNFVCRSSLSLFKSHEMIHETASIAIRSVIIFLPLDLSSKGDFFPSTNNKTQTTTPPISISLYWL